MDRAHNATVATTTTTSSSSNASSSISSRAATPTSSEAFAFFARYRRQIDENERNEGKAREVHLAEQQLYMLTQAQPTTVTRKTPAAVVNVAAATAAPRHGSGGSGNEDAHAAAVAASTAAVATAAATATTAAEDVSFIPVDQTKGTPSFRLRTLRSSPKNSSPSLLTRPKSLLPPPAPDMRRRITLVLDVDETLVHSSFVPKPEVHYDAELVVNYNQQMYTVYVKFRPYLHDFLSFVSERFEVVIFTASLSAYCNPLIDMLDEQGKLGNLRLFREHCVNRNSSYIKDLFLLGRDLGRIAIIDNSPTAYLFQQRNAIPIKSWFDDPHDEELIKLYTLLGKLAKCESVYDILDEYNATGIVR